MSSELKSIHFEKPLSSALNQAKIGRWLAPIILFFMDYVAVLIALSAAVNLRGQYLVQYYFSYSDFDIPNDYFYFIIPMIYLVLLAYEKLYTKRLPFWQHVELLFKVSAYASIMVIGLLFLSHVTQEVSRLLVVFSWALSFIFLTISRYFSKRLLLKMGLWQKPVVIVGAGKTAELLIKAFEEEPGMGYKIVGLIEDRVQERPLLQKYPVIGTFKHLEEAIQKSNVQDVMLATPGLEREELLNLIYRIQPFVNNLTIVPDLFGMPLANIEVDTFYNEKAILLKNKNNLRYWYNQLFKKMFDFIVGICLFVAVLPLQIVLAVLIKIDSVGPVFHNAERIGKAGKPFKCYKFRTMYQDSDEILASYLNGNPEAKQEWSEYAKLRSYDPRVTKVGVWLRKYSLDELPQIINVLLGNMSLVGPRPYLPRERDQMSFYYETILYAAPGITGLWQVSGRNDVTFEGRLQMDSWYVRNWSLWQDIVILIKTVNVVLGRKGAY